MIDESMLQKILATHSSEIPQGTLDTSTDNDEANDDLNTKPVKHLRDQQASNNDSEHDNNVDELNNPNKRARQSEDNEDIFSPAKPISTFATFSRASNMSKPVLVSEDKLKQWDKIIQQWGDDKEDQLESQVQTHSEIQQQNPWGKLLGYQNIEHGQINQQINDEPQKQTDGVKKNSEIIKK
ncbi:MAG: hypothetical protein EZS28_005016 [Streblomastix strix]|uniref:Uncharacterized protein n=1 Tax=Streblomastix strix TaxID=222440 RepID=A0A5J4WWN8_9EUKA|nr:MAG: hypothetical protein EZS28_005016 [Streblomastix strix]